MTHLEDLDEALGRLAARGDEVLGVTGRTDAMDELDEAIGKGRVAWRLVTYRGVRVARAEQTAPWLFRVPEHWPGPRGPA